MSVVYVSTAEWLASFPDVPLLTSCKKTSATLVQNFTYLFKRFIVAHNDNSSIDEKTFPQKIKKR